MCLNSENNENRENHLIPCLTFKTNLCGIKTGKVAIPVHLFQKSLTLAFIVHHLFYLGINSFPTQLQIYVSKNCVMFGLDIGFCHLFSAKENLN